MTGVDRVDRVIAAWRSQMLANGYFVTLLLEAMGEVDAPNVFPLPADVAGIVADEVVHFATTDAEWAGMMVTESSGVSWTAAQLADLRRGVERVRRAAGGTGQ